MVTLHEVITFLVSMQISISSLQTHNVNRCGRSRHLARKDRKSGSAGMPRPISYAVFCLKKKSNAAGQQRRSPLSGAIKRSVLVSYDYTERQSPIIIGR